MKASMSYRKNLNELICIDFHSGRRERMEGGKKEIRKLMDTDFFFNLKKNL